MNAVVKLRDENEAGLDQNQGKQYQHLNTYYDPTYKIGWFMMNAAPRPCFTPTLLNELSDYLANVKAEMQQSNHEKYDYLVVGSSVDGVFNAVVVESDFCKKNFFLGEGAGAYPTATSIISDIIDICRSNKNFNTNKNTEKKKITFSKIDERIGSYYLRFTTYDQPGVISGISNEFKKNNISMKSMLQKDPHVSNQN